MALVKKTELRGMSNADLQNKLAELEAELLAELRTRKTSGKPANPGKYREMRRLRARIKTLLSKRGVKV
ncbi:MAG: 50S ribosomal protein L29 [Candidatus Norongarragalinales archaeon]